MSTKSGRTFGRKVHASLAGFERRLWVTDIPRWWAVRWEGQAQGQAKGRGSPRFPEEFANPRLLGGQADESLQVPPGRKAELRLRQLPAKSKRRHSNPAIRQGKLQKRGGGRRSEALGHCILGAEARRSVQTQRCGFGRCWQKTWRCEFARCWQKTEGQSRRQGCAWQMFYHFQLARERPAIQRHSNRTPCDVDGQSCEKV